MPLRPARILEKIAIFPIGAVVVREVKKAGEELVWIVVKVMSGHLSDISLRTRAICHPLTAVTRAGPAPCGRVVERPVPRQYMMAVVDP